MKKSDFWKLLWNPLRKRQPPETDEEILTWNPLLKKKMIVQAKLVLYSWWAQKEEDEISQDRMWSHWCYIKEPER